MTRTSKSRLLILLVFLLFLTGCQPKVYLMPPPASLKPGSQFFDLSEDSLDDNLLYTFYVTNRSPFADPNPGMRYSIFPSQNLRFGYVAHTVGEEGSTWEDIYQQSLQADREEDLLIKRAWLREMAVFDQKDNMKEKTDKGDGFFDQLNQTLDKSFSKDLLVYVHGANCNFYRGTAQGAQFYHFLGHNSVVLSFSWPSAENILKYSLDVAHAKKSIPSFANLIEILADRSKARKINIIAYSAGAQIVAPGLASLRDLHPDESAEDLKKRLRIGEVYFAGPDAEFKPFAGQYLKFKDIVDRTSINMNYNDSVLGLSEWQNGKSRLGRPNPEELSEEERQVYIDATFASTLDVLNVGDSSSLDLGGDHDSWYSHPWVSNDLLLLLMTNASPEGRGLLEYSPESGGRGYYFPDDYITRFEKNLNEYEGELRQKGLIK